MIPYPNISPVLVTIGPLTVRWYGVMFLAAFLGAWYLARQRAAAATSTWQRVDVDEGVFQGAIGAILGARLWWLLLHGLGYEMHDPLRVLRIWEGGMSFHGAMLGGIIALARFARQRHLSVADVLDFAAPLPAVGLFTLGLSSFINADTWGRPTQLPWAIVYQGVPRHPLQLYDAFFEGIVLGTALWVFTSRPRPRLAPSGFFLAGYGLIRFLIDFMRASSDEHGYEIAGGLNEGQLLALPMIALGVGLLGLAYHRRQPSGNARSWAEPAA